uniref:AB hydrolase-1 domain-containing protein n=1 Tax=Globisporangium ultimum (strain ATCC 200006 / CBS 805.95 / DAOM BR144) TaxID=431595 RepID=K3W993_GLOUD
MSASTSSPSATIIDEWEQLPHHFAPVADGIELHFVDVGPRDATPVVLLHGWPDFSFAWRYQVGELSKKYRVIAPDMRGFGRSSVPREIGAYGSKNITSDLSKLLDFLNLPRAVFVGHDWGGNIVYRMCLYHPDRVLAVAGICTPYFPPSDTYVSLDALVATVPSFAYMKFLADDTEASSKHLEIAPRQLFTAVYRPPQPAQDAEKNDDVAPKPTFLDVLRGIGHSSHPVYTHRSELLSQEELDFYVSEYTKSGFKGAVNFYATRELDFETERDLPRIIPHQALYVGAGRDPVLKPELAAHMPQVVPRIEFALVEEGGHWLLWSNKQEVTDVLLKWLDKLDTTASP